MPNAPTTETQHIYSDHQFRHEPPKDIKGRGVGRRTSTTFKSLQEIKRATEADPTEVRYALVGSWENASTASGVARSITHANTYRARAANQKVPAGFWLAGTEPVGLLTQVWAKYLGPELTPEHPQFEGDPFK